MRFWDAGGGGLDSWWHERIPGQTSQKYAKQPRHPSCVRTCCRIFVKKSSFLFVLRSLIFHLFFIFLASCNPKLRFGVKHPQQRTGVSAQKCAQQYLHDGVSWGSRHEHTEFQRWLNKLLISLGISATHQRGKNHLITPEWLKKKTTALHDCKNYQNEEKN